MAYSVDLEYTINEDFSNPQTISESGKPTSMTLQGLQSNQTYYTKAVLKNDGTVENETEITSFQTLPAGTITLNHYQTTRSGYDYEVVYLYSSTYAPSWARLAVNGSTFQGTFDSAQHAVSFLVTGLTPGTAYLDLVTLGDIYGEEASVQGSIVTTVVNDVDITSVDTAYTSADVNVEYIVDGGFYVGYVEWWLGTQDPAQDQPQGHEYFNNGAETVTISNLSSGTEYKFKASITLNDQVTTVSSSVVAAETEIPYAQRYFTIENVADGSNTIGLLASNENAEITVDVSTDNGQTWSHVTSNTSGATLATLGVGEKLIMKHVDGLGYDSSNGNKITATDSFTAYGNIASLTHDTGFNTTGLTMPDYAFVDLFNGVGNKLVDAANIDFSSYSTAGGYGCYRTFYQCSAIKTTPNLSSITTLKEGCYMRMFLGCSGLMNVTTLPASTMFGSSYDSMFSGCSSLVNPPSLPATTLAGTCYSYMFHNCSSLVNPPSLPATTMMNWCYQYMFSGCSSLTTAPSLPATSTAAYSYTAMFSGCTSLRTAPRLDHVTSIGTGGLNSMFSGCSLINEMYAPSVTTWNTANTSNWLSNVAASGTMHKLPTLSMPTDSASGIPVGWTAAENYEMAYFTIVNRGSGTGLNNNSIKITSTQACNIDYSTDNGATWSTRNVTANTSTVITTLNPGKKVMLKATSSFYGSKTFDATDIFDIEGNIASLMTTGDFRTASNLSISARQMFYNCTKLINAENAVFDTCTSIPQNGCKEMFYGCSSLVTAPKRLPSTVGANACESMFAQCRSLTNVPELPATITQNYCYASMFTSCISLTEAQDELPATYIREASYRGMYYGCVRLQKSPDLKNATNGVSGAMGNMFYNCESLETVYAPSFRTWNRFITQTWLYGVAPEGVLYKPAELEIPKDTPDGVPEGWTTEDY